MGFTNPQTLRPYMYISNTKRQFFTSRCSSHARSYQLPSPYETTMSAVTITETHVTKEEFLAPSKPWETIRDEKRAEQMSRIPEPWRLQPSQYPVKDTVDVRPIATTSGILSERELDITGSKYDATSLAAEIAKGTFTAVETVTAFCKRAAICQQLCSALTEIFFADAIEKAKKLDEHFRETGKTVGPLHGLPMTFKVRHYTHNGPSPV